jgi:hypothetical protein
LITRITIYFQFHQFRKHSRGCDGRDHMAVGFTTTYAIGAYHHWCCGVDSCSGRGVQHCVKKFVGDFSGSCFLDTNKTDRYDITEILLKVALNTMKPTNVKQVISTQSTLLKIMTLHASVISTYCIYITKYFVSYLVDVFWLFKRI